MRWRTPGWREIEAIYRSDFARFARVARAIAGDRETALEAVQEGFADALRHAGQRSGRGSLDAWVWRCVVNRALTVPACAPSRARATSRPTWTGDPADGE